MVVGFYHVSSILRIWNFFEKEMLGLKFFLSALLITSNYCYCQKVLTTQLRTPEKQKENNWLIVNSNKIVYLVQRSKVLNKSSIQLICFHWIYSASNVQSGSGWSWSPKKCYKSIHRHYQFARCQGCGHNRVSRSNIE